ncbi:class I SAM-dependent methyltransferase [Chryseobacterium koreense]
MAKYIHKTDVHNLDSPKEIVPELIKIFKPKSVADFGCGLGTFLYCFKEAGVNDILGLDGNWVNRDLLSTYLAPNEFRASNLEEKITLQKKYDLVISLEVAEHISEKSADTFVENLVNAGDLVVFGASIPFQEGQNHLNEQWVDYWEMKFNEKGYKMLDILRPVFWDNPNIFWWYRQNMVLFVPKDFAFDTDLPQNVLKKIVHPDWYLDKSKRLEVLMNGDAETKLYLKLLMKSITKAFTK